VPGDEVPWSLECFRYGAEFTPDGGSVRVIGRFETNGKRLEGQVVARASAEGEFRLADGSFHPGPARVLDAGIVSYSEAGDEVLRPRVVFPDGAGPAGGGER
jgi:hypothetical protein